MNSKYLGVLWDADVIALLDSYKEAYGTHIKIVPNKLVFYPTDATEIEVQAGKHAPIWFKKKNSYFEVYSDFMPDGDGGCFDCARACETRVLCSKLEELAVHKIKVSRSTTRMHKAEA
jgi:hypothetical protein